MVNILPFGLCTSLANPAVAAATAAAMGVLIAVPCRPATNTPWSPGAPLFTLDHAPALDDLSICRCDWGGVVTVADAGQGTIFIP